MFCVMVICSKLATEGKTATRLGGSEIRSRMRSVTRKVAQDERWLTSKAVC